MHIERLLKCPATPGLGLDDVESVPMVAATKTLVDTVLCVSGLNTGKVGGPTGVAWQGSY